MSEKNAPSPIGRPLCKKKINLIAATFENDKNPKPETIAHLANILKLSEKRIKIEFARLRAKNKKDQYLEVIKVKIVINSEYFFSTERNSKNYKIFIEPEHIRS